MAILLAMTSVLDLLLPARLGGVAEHHRSRGAAPAAEDLEQPGAQALRPLRHEGDALPVVRVRERRDQQPGVEGPPADRGAEVPEIDLAGAGCLCQARAFN